MNRLILFVVAATYCSIGCSESSQTPANPPSQDMPTLKSLDTENDASDSPQENSQPAQNDTTDRLAELDNVFEALFRYQFKHNASGAQQNAKGYFLVIKNKDPSPEFLKWFAHHKKRVRNGSEFAIGRGLKFKIDTWKWMSDNELELTGGYYEAGLSSTSGNRYTLIRKNGEWGVEKVKGGEIS